MKSMITIVAMCLAVNALAQPESNSDQIPEKPDNPAVQKLLERFHGSWSAPEWLKPPTENELDIAREEDDLFRQRMKYWFMPQEESQSNSKSFWDELVENVKKSQQVSNTNTNKK